MKIRNGFVSNSSSSSFILYKEAISDDQLDKILRNDLYIEKIIQDDETLAQKFEYYDTDPWNIEVHEDYIFGETSMDNFSIGDYLEYLGIDNKYLRFTRNDDYWDSEPVQDQLSFIKQCKQQYRKDKIIKINKS